MSDPVEALRLFITNTASRSRLDIGGEIDVATVDTVRDHLALLVHAGTGDVDVDMATVTFCDATVLRVLVGAREQLHTDGRHLHIINASPATTRLLELAGLDTTLLASPDRQPHHPPQTAPTCRARTPTDAAGRTWQEEVEDADRQTRHRSLR